MIIVTGLPRSGTTSVGRALSEMGLETLFFCPLTHKNGKWGEEIERAIRGEKFSEQLHNFDSIVSWRLLVVHDKLQEIFNPSHIIICDRSVGWETSMQSFGFSNIECELFKALINCVKREFFNALSLDISQGIYYNEIAEFLELETEKQGKIPHLNRGRENYSI